MRIQAMLQARRAGVRRGRRLLAALLGGGLLAVVLAWGADRLWPLPLPAEDSARIVLAHDGTPLWRFADVNGVWRHAVRPDEVSPLYLQALLGYEDRWFYRHPGINPLALARAAWLNAQAGHIVSGGSTLSMQVARLLEPHPRTLRGKLRQMARTLQLEWHLSKDEILTLYLNRAPFGGTIEGIAAASWTLLGKPPKDLTHAEAALLVVLPQAPSRLRPDRYPERATAARDKVLMRMRDNLTWPHAVVDEALQEAVLLAPRDPPGLAPLFARRVVAERAGARVRTTVDARLQRRVEALVHAWRGRLPPRTSAAVMVVEHDTMAVRAYLGSADFDNEQRFGHVDMVRAVRSPGSTLKPFLTGLALDAGLIHSESLLQDVPRVHATYRPGNFASGFSGPVSAAEALARSLNLPAVQLLEAYGARRFQAELTQAGVPLVLPPHAAPSLAVILGGVGTRLEDLLAGYRAFARGGRSARLRWFDDAPLVERRLMSEGAAWIVRQTLLGRRASGQPLAMDAAAHSTLAWKTGTSYGFRDAWAIGVGPRYLIGVWIGRPDGTPVAAQFGVGSAAPLLFQVHELVRGGAPDWHEAAPAAVAVRDICWPGGQTLSAAHPDCRQLRQAWVLDGIVPPTLPLLDHPSGGAQRLVHWLDSEGQWVAPDCANAHRTELLLWPAALEAWLPAREQRAQRLPPRSSTCPPPPDPRASAPLQIVGLRDGDIVRLVGGRQGPLALNLSATGGAGLRRWFLGGEPIGSSQGETPLALTLDRPGEHQLSVIDESGQIGRIGIRVLGR